MSKLDDQIRAALSAEDRALLDEYADEPGILDLVAGTFRGKMRFWSALSVFMTLPMFALSVWCFVELVTADDVLVALRWGAGFLWSALAVAMLKMWFWMQMNQQAVLREIKRVELQVARGSSGGG